MIWLLPVSAILIGAGQATLLHYIYRVNINTALADSIISVTILSLSLWGVAQTIRIYPTRVGITIYSLLSAVFFSLSTVFISTYILKWWIGETDPAYLTFLSQSGPIRYVIFWLICSWASTFIALNKQSGTLQKQFKQQADTAALHKEAELFKLRQQLQPHFLYNSLNSISALTIADPEKAREMIGKLSDFLRNSVQRETKEKIPIADELAYLQNYLAIESVRFGDRLNVKTEIPENINVTLPPFLLQPLLENAIKFGLYGNTGKVTITVNIATTGNLLSISITNPYDGSAGQQSGGTGFGLAGVKRRLYLVYARTDLLQTQSDNGKYTTTLKIPQDDA